jgi:predicted MFS family arabinose efflux permease
MMFAPRFLLGWAAMGWVDRWHKRRILLTADIARCFLLISIAAFRSYGWTLVAVFLVYTFQMLYQPTVRAIQPALAGTQEANRVSVARQEQWSQAGTILAYVFAGVLMVSLGPIFGFLIDAASYAASAVLVGTLPRDLALWTGNASARMAPYGQQIREGFRYARQHRLVLALMGVSFAAMMGAAGSSVLIAAAMGRRWHQPTAYYAWALMALALGAMMSAWWIEKKGEHWSLRYVLLAGFALTGVSTAVLIVIGPHLWLVMLVLAFGGVGNAMFSTSVMVWLQQSLPLYVRGRVMTLRTAILGLGGVIASYGMGAVIVHSMVDGFVAVAALFGICAGMMLVPWLFAEASDEPGVPIAVPDEAG